MANTQSLKRRIRSVGNTKQITKAMELVAAAKMRRVVTAAEQTRLYSQATISILNKLIGGVEAQHNPFFNPPTSKNKLYIVFSSDSGLAGAYNANVFNLTANTIKEDTAKGWHARVVVYGRKGAHHFSHASNLELIGEYEGVADQPDPNVFAPVLEIITQAVKEGELGAVELIFTEFQTSLRQQARLLPLVPVQPEQEAESEADKTVFEFEPASEIVLEEALRLYFESSLLRARVESAASEHAMRMMSMNNANRNAGDLIDSLTLELNASRQAAITQEMAEIIGGANAIV